jgi:protein SCO1/2
VSAQPVGEVPEQMAGIVQDDKRGSKLDLDLEFVDQNGKSVTLRNYFTDGRPVLLTMNYYMCTMLCTEVLNGLVEGLSGLDWTPGEKFQVVTVSIDEREKPWLAKKKQAAYLEELGRDGANWSFLTGSKKSIDALSAATGFAFRYDDETDQFAHPPTIMFVSPDGVITQYLMGKMFQPDSIRWALMDASEGTIGSTFERLAWSCFHYDDKTGQYTPYAMGIMRLGGAATVMILSFVLTFWWLRERRYRTLEPQLMEQLT